MPFYVQCEAMEKTLQAERPCSSEFHVVMEREVEKVNSHVVACLGVLESASPASDNGLVRCSSECGILSTFIHCNRDALREIAKDFNEKMRNATGACCTRFSMRTFETASFRTSLLERVLNVQARLEESVLQEHGGDSFCSDYSRKLTRCPPASRSRRASMARPKRPLPRACPRCRSRHGRYAPPEPAAPVIQVLPERDTPLLQPHGSTGRGLPTSPRWRFRRPSSRTTLKRDETRLRADCGDAA